MALFDLLRRKPEAKSPVARRRKRKTESGSAVLAWMEKSKVVAFAVFVLTVAAIFIVSFVGVGPAAFHILPNQEATIRIIADSDFSFTSAIQTARNRERLLREVPPVYRVDLEPTDRFEMHVRQVLADLNTLDDRWATLSEAERLRELSTIAESATTRGGLQVGIRDLAAIMNFGDAAARERLIVENGLYYVREIQRAGVYTPPNASPSGDERDITLFNVRRDSGATTTVRVSTVESARTTLRIGLAA
jgi:membrane-associated HD superfamily phosphohydrolase